jgi:hypothetical protein
LSPSSTHLASGKITNADTLIVELVEPDGLPPVIRFKWPEKFTVCPPAQLNATVAAAMRILSNSVVELAALRVWKKL